MVERTIQGIRFNVESPSLYICAAAPEVKIWFNGFHWFLMFNTRLKQEVSLHSKFEQAVRELAGMVQDIGAGMTAGLV